VQQGVSRCLVLLALAACGVDAIGAVVGTYTFRVNLSPEHLTATFGPTRQ
jgi:hypothetical protein